MNTNEPDAVAVQLCLSAGLTQDAAETLIHRIMQHAAKIAETYPGGSGIGQGIAAKIRESAEYDMYTQGARHTYTPAYDGRDPMRNRQ